MERATQWKIAGALWLVVILLWLSSCERTDIDILEVNAETEPATMRVSVGPDVTEDQIMEWAMKECRDIMVLPPIRIAPKIGLRLDIENTNRTEYRIACTRP